MKRRAWGKTHSKEKTSRDQTWAERLSKQCSASEDCSGCQREWEKRKTMETFSRDCECWSCAHMLGKLQKHSENSNLKWDLPLTQASAIDCALQGNTTDFFFFVVVLFPPLPSILASEVWSLPHIQKAKNVSLPQRRSSGSALFCFLGSGPA